MDVLFLSVCAWVGDIQREQAATARVRGANSLDVFMARLPRWSMAKRAID
jgi:hypothetical protein